MPGFCNPMQRTYWRTFYQRGMAVNNQRLHISGGTECTGIRNVMRIRLPGGALARIAREEQLHAQVKRIREIKYKLAWTNPAFLCSANHRRNCIGYQENQQR